MAVSVVSRGVANARCDRAVSTLMVVFIAVAAADVYAQNWPVKGEGQSFQGTFVPEDYSPYQPYMGSGGRGGAEISRMPSALPQSVPPGTSFGPATPYVPYMQYSPYGFGSTAVPATGFGAYPGPHLYPGFGGVSPYGSIYSPFGVMPAPGLTPMLR